MTLAAGTRVGPYEVIALVDAGGQGEVYRARDGRLDREVALKVLPGHVELAPGRRERFDREARVLASLNHPNIATLYGLEESPAGTVLVMELVEGETLADRLAFGGPIPVEQAIAIAAQIARALDAAHEQGIVHRDLKPANVRVRPDGTVKVLDFGLAKAIETGASDAADQPGVTATSPAPITRAETIIGTAAYMSPEQTRGERVDSRTDVWAFGCVLYEMLTGRRAFEGPTPADIHAAVLGTTPDWSRLPAVVPPALRTLIQRCLVREVRQRLRHVGAALLLLEERDLLASGASASGASEAAVPAARSRRRAGAWLVAAAFAAGAVLAAGASWIAWRPEPPAVVRTSVLADTFVASTDQNFGLTPDGSRLVYVSSDATQLMVRRMDAAEAVPILTTTSYLRGVVPSPDGHWVGFIENAFTLRKVSIAGGAPVTLLQMDGPSRGAAWGPGDRIVFATGSTDTGLQMVAGSGGPVTVLTRPDQALGEFDHLNPAWLPSGRAVLFTVRTVSGGVSRTNVAVLDLATQRWHTVIEGGLGARYVEGGYLVYAAADALWVVRFDAERLQVVGTPVELLKPAKIGSLGAVANVVVTSGGTLVHPIDAPSDSDSVVPVWVDRQGRETPLAVPPALYRHPRLSPDGRQLAIVAANDIVVWDMSRPWSTAERMTFTPAVDWYPVWMPDGRRLVFGSWRGGGFSNIYVQELNSTTAVRLTDSPDMQLPTSVTPDGSGLVFHSFTKGIEMLPLTAGASDRTAEPVPLLETPLEERNAVVSPDGRWLAYEAETSANPGQLDVFVRPFPGLDRGVWQLTLAGGIYPAWCPKCRELFYQEPDGALVSRPVEATGSQWRAGEPVRLFRGPYFYYGDGTFAREFDVSADGRRFLMLKSVRDDRPGPPRFVVVQHWLTELTRRMTDGGSGR